MTPEHIALIQDWGYWLMFGSAIIEGETFLILGGIAAAAEMLNLKVIILLSILGALIHDSFFFYLGRFSGPKLLKRKPNWQPKVERVSILLEKYDIWLIMAFRFAYGLRAVIPFALGVSKISNIKFFIFDVLGAVVWVVLFVLGGYYFGNMLEAILAKLSLLSFVKEHWIISLIVLMGSAFGITFLLIHLFKKRKIKKVNTYHQEV